MLIENKSSKSNDKPVMTLSAFCIQGKRVHMEDYYDIGYQMKPCDQQRPNEWPYEYFYLGVFDGHGGYEAAEFAKNNLLKFITKQKDFWSDIDEDVKRSISQGFAETHSAMRKEMPKWNRTNRSVLPSTAGTTASIIFIKNGKFYTGHVGDSRIVISRENEETKQWISQSLTEDHKPESEEELARIRRAGGDVKDKMGVHRVVWKRPVLKNDNMRFLHGYMKPYDSENLGKDIIQTSIYPVDETLVDSYQTIPFLAIARSLGDFWSINPHSGQYIVSPEPDVACRPIDPNDKCILLASDGLWNVMNSPLAVRILQELSAKRDGKQLFKDEYFVTDNFYDVAGEESENYAQSLVYFAYQIWARRRLRSDNITVVVAMLQDILAAIPKEADNTNKNCLKLGYSMSSQPVQIDDLCLTKTFLEKIRLNTEPNLSTPIDYFRDYEKWEQLEDMLILPPTILEKECPSLNVVWPRNYTRLSVAACRKILRHHEALSDSFIYIKRVSDDPADEQELPVRLNKSGKEVRDASAQATQGIHDFGQPWSQLLGDCEFQPFGEETREEIYAAAEKMFEEFDREMADRKISICVEDMDLDEEKETKESIPQLRCLLNRSPPLRRSTRNTDKLVTRSEHVKRRDQISSNISLPKTKRRKSQPNIRCN